MKNNKLPSVVVLLILSLITVLFWISFTVYRVFSSKPTPNVPEEIIKDINPSLDKQTLEQIKGRINPQ